MFLYQDQLTCDVSDDSSETVLVLLVLGRLLCHWARHGEDE